MMKPILSWMIMNIVVSSPQDTGSLTSNQYDDMMWILVPRTSRSLMKQQSWIRFAKEIYERLKLPIARVGRCGSLCLGIIGCSRWSMTCGQIHRKMLEICHMPNLCSDHQHHSSGTTAINQPEFLNTLPKTEPYNMEMIQRYCLYQKSGIWYDHIC